MKKVLILVFSNLKHDARILRQINFLKDAYDLTVCCYDAEPNGFRFIKLHQVNLTLIRKAFTGILLLLRQFTWAHHLLYPYRNFLINTFHQESFDLIISNDIETLPLAFDLKKTDTKILFDAHEYAPRHFENVYSWRLFFQAFNIYLCKRFISKVNAMTTVGTKIAEEYEKHFGIRPTVITNAPAKQTLLPMPVGSVIRMVHHGIGTPSRKIELMIEMMRHLPEHFELDLILITPPSASAQTVGYIDQLKFMANFTNRIHFIPPLSSDEIIPFINQYDLGVIIIPPVNFNYENCLPNKFFDYIQARVALAIGPTPEMALAIKKYNLGIVSKEFTATSLAVLIKDLTPDQIMLYKQNTGIAVNEFNADNNKKILLGIVNTLLS